jgi:hypothetical protein
MWYASLMANRRLGLIFGFVIALCLVAGAIYSIAIGQFLGVALGASAASMVPSLIRGWNGDRPSATDHQREDESKDD